MLYHRKVLSVLVPVLNNEVYIQQCLESALALAGADVEVCVSDNASTDGTWGIVSDLALIHSNLVCIRQSVRVDFETNFKSALDISSGDLVYLLGADDYIVPPGLEGATQRLAREPSLAGITPTMCYFSESSGLELETLPPSSAEEHLNGSAHEVILWMMKNINHDELMLTIWRRSAIEEAIALVSPTCQEDVTWWWPLYAMLIHDSGVHRFEVTTDVVLMKRYEKPPQIEETQENSAAQAKAILRVKEAFLMKRLKLKDRLERRKGSARNSLGLWHSGIIGRKTMLKLLLGKRCHSNNPDYELWIFSLGIRRAVQRRRPTRLGPPK